MKLHNAKAFYINANYASYDNLSDQAKIVQLLGLLTSKVLTWVTVIWNKGRELVSSYEDYINMPLPVLDHVSDGKDVREELLTIQQGEW